MTPQFSNAAAKDLQTELYPLTFPACLPSDSDRLSARDRGRKNRLVNGTSALFATIVSIMFLLPSSFAQEHPWHPYSEYTYWFGGEFENGHAFSSTIGGRNYQLESRYERLIYWKEPFAVRWVFDAVPLAFVGDPRTGTGHRAYSYGAGGSPVGAQVNFVHFATSNHFSQAVAVSCTLTIGCLGPLSSTLPPNLAAACSCSHQAAAPPLTWDTNTTIFLMRI